MTSNIPMIKLSNAMEMPIIGLGTYGITQGKVSDVVKCGIDIGYRLFDTAVVYRNEKEVGEGIMSKIQDATIKREDIFIISKLWNTDHEPEKVVPAIKRSLFALGIEYLDLYLIHWPMATKEGIDKLDLLNNDEVDVPLEDTWQAMEKCVELGFTKAIGLSNFNSIQIQRILKVAQIKPVVNQVECNPYFNQKKLIAFCKQHELTVMAYSPLRPVAYIGDAKPEIPVVNNKTVMQLATKYSKTPGQIILRYLTQLDTVVIAKTETLSRLKENMDIFDFKLTDGDMKIIDSLDNNTRCLPYHPTKSLKEYPFAIEF